MMTKRIEAQQVLYWFLVRVSQALAALTVFLIVIIIMNDIKIRNMERPTIIEWDTICGNEESIEEQFQSYIDSLPVPDMSDVPCVNDRVDDAMKEEKNVSEPGMKTLNVSAYCACEKCCGKTDGITASNTKAQQWHTVAAGPSYKFGTKIYIPDLADTPSGGWFVVEDRGGKIDDVHLDIFFDDHQAALEFGRHNYDCIIYD